MKRDHASVPASGIAAPVPALLCLETWDTHTPATEPMFRPQHHEILIFMEGQGLHTIDENSFPFFPGDIHFIEKAVPHRLQSHNGTYGCSLIFREDYFIYYPTRSNFLNALPFSKGNPQQAPALALSKEEFFEIELILDKLQALQALTPHPQREELLHVAFYEFLSYCQYRYTLRTNPTLLFSPQQPGSPRLRAFTLLLEQHFREHHETSFYAERLGMHPNSLNALCKKQEGKTASELIRQCLQKEAQDLLCHSDLAVKEIAERLNFSDSKSFIRFFRKQSGLSPIAWRRAHL